MHLGRYRLASEQIPSHQSDRYLNRKIFRKFGKIFRLIGTSRGEEAPGNQNLEENFTVTTIVELVSSRVQEFEHSIEVNSDLNIKIFRNFEKYLAKRLEIDESNLPLFRLCQNLQCQFWRDPQRQSHGSRLDC